MRDLEKARKNLEHSGVLYDIEMLGENLSLLGCFDKADGVMDWAKIGEIISFIGREIYSKVKFIQKELELD
ncbi:hypothetical protein KDD93_03535 [Campylobacter sp. faydin G-24]|uniref:Uncharacterized protein n=1 Tax=Campylobacter anatolicus TaxID=2829105 RepID=A0ABS5HH92_9BACT|nr:hypothetical protein [Campylobacter anatolicus]MBR8463645.1 hypothetical protein [Campylobacter anatolicus]